MSFVGSSMEETKVIYYIDDEETPYLVKIPIPPGQVTLADFKNVANKTNYKFFFKSMDDDFGVVKEEIVEDDAKLPFLKGRVVSWLVTAEGSNVSDTTSQCTEVTSSQRAGSGNHGSNHVDNHFSECDSVASLRRDRHSHRMGRHKDKHYPEEHGNGCKGPCCNSSRVNCHYKHNHGHAAGRHNNQDFDTSSMMTSDIESTSFFDSEDETTSRISTTTEETSVSKIHARHRRRRRKHRMPLMSRTSSISSITDSTMSLNIITVTLNLDTVNFLGISIVGQSNKGGDGGIYVGSIMKGGAVAIDGRIEPGDMILQVNDINFENMSNDDAVRVLREAVQKPGPIKLVVAKCWDPNPKGYFTIPRMEPVRPIDPGAWVAHTEAARANECSLRPPSVSTLTSTSSSLTSSIPESDRHFTETNLTIDTDLPTIVKAMAAPDSGLDVRDRMWLKIIIPSSFIGADVVDWLFSHVQGFIDRRDARKLATQLLKEGYIKHTVTKITFSEHCYFVFGDLCNSVAALKVNDEDSVSEADRDTLGPLPPPASLSPWGNQMPYSGSYLPHASGFVPMPFSFANDPPNYHPFEQEGSVNSGSGGSSNGINGKKKKSPVETDSDMTSQRSVSALHLNGEGAGVGGGSSGSESANSQIRRDAELTVEDDILEYRYSDKGVV